MTALSADLILTLNIQRSGVTANLVAEAVSLADQTFDEQAVQYVEVADGVTDQAIALGPLTTAETVLIISDETVSLKVNGAAAGIDGETFLLTGAAVTSLSVSNASGALASLRVILLGT